MLFRSSEDLGEVSSEVSEFPGGVARYQLDVIRDEVTVALAESCRVLAHSIGHPLRKSHADHSFPGGLNWDVDVVDLLAQGLGEPGCYIVE